MTHATPPSPGRFQHIVLGLDLDPRTEDLSAGSRAAVEQALWIATQSDARVDVIHSVATDHVIEAHGAAFVVVHDGPSERGRAALEAVVQRFADVELPAQLLLRAEKPWLSITKEVIEHAADLVIVGRHDREKPGGSMGSVARKLVHKCPSAVWVVRPDARPVPKTVLVGTDLSDVGFQAMRYGGFLTDQAHGELHVVHAFQIPLAGEMIQARTAEDHIGPLRAQAEETLRGQVAKLGLARKPELHVGCTTPLRAIEACIERLQPDLLVLGTISRGGIPGFLVGNTAEKVLGRVETSLLTVKPEGFVSPVAAAVSQS